VYEVGGTMRRASIAVIRCYQGRVSGRLARRCAQTPSCSEYAARAIADFGLISGSRRALARYRRCRRAEGA
jgi:uncharacterized protein